MTVPESKDRIPSRPPQRIEHAFSCENGPLIPASGLHADLSGQMLMVECLNIAIGDGSITRYAYLESYQRQRKSRYHQLKNVTGSLFDGLRRINDDPNANPNLAVIAYAETKGFLFDKEPDFLRATARKRKLSAAQKAWKEKINRRIVNQIVVKRRTVR